MSEEKIRQDSHLADSLNADASSPNSIIPRLQQALATCSQLIEAGDISKSNELVAELVDFLNPISVSVVEDASNVELETTAFEILTEIDRFISSPSRNQEVIDALSFELPKVVCKFACASNRCSEIAELIVGHLVSMCSPRDMLSILCAALSSPSETFNVPCYFAPLIGGLTKVIILIQRRQFEQVKTVIPVILGVLKSVSLEADDEDKDTEELFHKAIVLAESIQAVCKKLEQKDKKKLCALLGLFVLQLMALASIAMGRNISSLLPIVLYLSRFLPLCGISYEGLITGPDIDKFKTICGDDRDDDMACFSHVKHGGSLTVIWGYKSNEASMAADEDFEAVKNELQMNQTKRWQAIGMLKHVFSSIDLSWELKTHALDFLLCIMDGGATVEIQNDNMDYYTYMPTLYTALQAIEMVIIYAPNAVLRKKSFDALKKVLADVPSSLRFDILKALIQNNECSSMIAILLDCFKREMLAEHSRSISVTSGVSEAEVKDPPCASFWSAGALELVELVLKPPKGGPPSLPEYSDAVLSALNLYRFVLIRESTGKTNYTGVLSKDMLQKAYNEWLLPLRTLVTGVVAENQNDHDQLASDAICALNPIDLVLYRCIELVEDNLKHA
ncbi:aberrant root formation protein 4 [Nicotiana tomentosiformis]|uniref:aberrant root formation protein 4 n=1 Tax=Nicotiana tomentosiformis TaxID=4098 RepID=UPI00051B1CBB|nr:aberrant root formation protein 4 isoform X1 [Nicotiana tomentosiformis]